MASASVLFDENGIPLSLQQTSTPPALASAPRLGSPRPNPFNPATTISFDLPAHMLEHDRIDLVKEDHGGSDETGFGEQQPNSLLGLAEPAGRAAGAVDLAAVMGLDLLGVEPVGQTGDEVGPGGGELGDLDRFGRVAHVVDVLCSPPDRMAVVIGWVEIFFVDDQEGSFLVDDARVPVSFTFG